ncbi:MAG: MazG family protein [Microbacteriaceae bacterium]
MPQHEGLSGLIATMATLRSPGGCPWDLEQTHESLVPYLLEEVFELIEALEAGTRADVKEELGDVLYQLLFHADIASADPLDPFDIDEIAQLVDQKMRTRHPHVFASGDATTVAEVSARWEEIKAEEKAQRTSVLEGIPDKLSALARAASVVKRSQAVLASHHTSEGATYQSEAELGEVLLALVASARAQGFDPERALRVATRSYEDKVIEAERAQKLAKGH